MSVGSIRVMKLANALSTTKTIMKMKCQNDNYNENDLYNCN